MATWTCRRRLALTVILALPGRLYADVREAEAALPIASLTPPAARILKASISGIERIYEMDFPAAEREFRRIIEEDPGHPFSYYGMAGAAWVRYTYGTQRNDPALAAQLESQAGEAVRRAQLWIKRHPKDAFGHLALGASYGLRSRHSVMTGRWLKAVLDGRKAIKYTRHAYKLDPGLHDAALGIGMWEYYADVFPRLIKALGKLLLGGDRLAGIRHIQLAAEKGRLVKVTAQLALIEIYLHDAFGLRDPAKALAMIRGVRRQFPKSPIFHQVEQVAAYEAGELDAAEKLTNEYLRRIDAKALSYNEDERPRMQVFYGTIHFKRGELEAARAAFTKAADGLGPREKPNRWALWGLIRLGEVEDALGRRDEAKKRYKRVRDYADLWGFHDYAKARLKKPYKPGDPIGMVAPPA